MRDLKYHVKQTTLNSDKMKNKIQAMGINFEQLKKLVVFDCFLTQYLV